MCRCGQACVITTFINLCRQVSNPSESTIKSFADSVTQYLNKTSEFEESNKYDPIDIVSAVLVNIHCLLATGICYQDEESAFEDCRMRCPLHNMFYLGVKETYTCECGESYESNWEQNNICQFFNTSGLFEGFIEENSLVLANIPKEILGETEYGSSKMFFNSINRKLREKLEMAAAETCQREDCVIKSSRVRFEVINAPKVYIIDLIWDDDPDLITNLNCFFSTIGLQKSFKIFEIYINGSKKNYNINQIIFNRSDVFKVAKFKDPFWEMEGLHNQASWEDLLKEITLHRLYPISAIYIEGSSISQFDLDTFKLLKIEQKAAQCQEFRSRFGRPCVDENDISTGLFKVLKKPKVLIQQSKPDTQSKIISASRDSSSGLEYTRERINPNQEKQNYSEQISQSPPSKAMQTLGIYAKKSIERNLLDQKVIDFKPEEEVKTEARQEHKTMGLEQDDSLRNAQDEWKCICGEKNMSYFEKCIRCRKTKTGNNIEEWNCKKCKKINKQDNSYTCEHCREIDIDRYTILNKLTKNSSNYQVSKPAVEKVKKEEKIEIWECPCGASNMPDYLICTKCSKIKPGVKGWLCKNCQIVNEEYNSRCSICKSSKYEKETLNQNFWLCEQCNSAIQVGIDFCDGCGFIKENKKKTAEVKYAYDKTPSETDDYRYKIKKDDNNLEKNNICPNCKQATRKYAGKCLECYVSTADVKNDRNLKNEETKKANKDAHWECNKCYNQNRVESNICTKCRGPKDDKINQNDKRDAPGREKSLNLGDDTNEKKWKCKNCLNYNFEFISFCLKCNEIKPKNESDQVNYPSPAKKCYQCKESLDSKESGNLCTFCINKMQAELIKNNKTPTKDETGWTCKNCEVTMKSYNSSCNKCHRPKAIMSKKLVDEKQFLREKTCTRCNKSLTIIQCVCKRDILASNIKCIFCGINTESITICRDCAAVPSSSIYNRNRSKHY